ncbi:STAS domain-containing protein [Neobacillus sp. SM06]|uniref:STAS domain-containing protein n=1 Tax=Neobacillus sp. SM06 TaxID=3422492 RepID=UPI003D2E33E0
METFFEDRNALKDFIGKYRKQFEENLLNEAVNVRDKIDEILIIGNIDLLTNAYKLVLFVIEEQEEELDQFAKQEGIAWATHSLTLAFKLEWVQAIRRTLWKFLEEYFQTKETPLDLKNFFILEKRINDRIDQFLNKFFLSYSDFKDQLLEAQKRLVENLSVPIIPVTSTVSILPLIGSIDTYRTKVLEEKVLLEINRIYIQTLIIDFSGISEMEADVIDQLVNIIDGTAMMGCKAVITV